MKTTKSRWYRLKLWYCDNWHRSMVSGHRNIYCECGQKVPCNTRRNLLNGGRW